MSDIVYFWKDGEKSIGIDESLTLPQFTVSGIKQRDKKVVLSTGNYSRLLCEIQLIRSMGYYMIQVGCIRANRTFETNQLMKLQLTSRASLFARSTCPPP